MSDCTEGFSALTDAEPGYSEASSYYKGEVAEVFTSRALARAMRKSGDRFRMNVIRSVVNSVADRLDVMSTTVSGAGDGEGVSPAQARLVSILKANSFEFEFPNVLRRTSELGDGYVLVWRDPDAEAGEEPVLNYVSPLSMRIVYDIDNPRRKRFAVHVWKVRHEGQADGYRMNLLYADRIERWQTLPGMKPESEAAWTEAPADEQDPDSWTSDNPYGEVPVFHFRNGTPYGEPEHLHGYGAQDAINKIVIAHMSTVDFHIAPQRYALLEGDTADDADDFEMDDFGDDEAPESVEEREARKGLKSGPSEVWWLKGVKSVGQFAPSDSTNFTSPAAFYLKMLAQTTDTPLHMVDESNDEPSGESRRRKEAPLTKKVRDRSKMYAATCAEMLAFALKTCGLDGREVVVTFAPAEVVSDAEGWATIKSKIEAGVPVRQALAEAGYTPEQIEEWFPEGEENSFRVADLAVVADILQKVGAAVAMGIITAEEGRAMLPEGVLPDSGSPAPVLPRPAPEAPALDEPEVVEV